MNSNLFLPADVVESMPIPQADRKQLFKQIDMTKQYQKLGRGSHCSDEIDCITYYTTFGLPDPKSDNYFLTCNHAHTSHCSDCIDVIVALDDISQHTKKITEKDIAQEARFDFGNAMVHIIE